MPNETDEQTIKRIKTYPHNSEAEQSLLCCLLIDSNVAETVIPTLSADLFYNERHRNIFSACRNLFDQNKPIDVITVNDQLELNKKTDINMMSYLADINGMLPSAANYKEYVEILTRDMRHRQIINMCNGTIELAYNSSNYRDTMAFLEEEMHKLTSSTYRSDLVHIAEASGQLVARIDRLCHDKNSFRGLMTGFPRFDNIVNGLQKGALIILAARPSVGKTSFALNIVSNIVTETKKDAVVAVFSLEMPSMQLAQRMISEIREIPMDSLTKGTTQDKEQEALIAAHNQLSESKVYVDDTAMQSPSDIFSKCRRLYAQEKHLDLIVIDYLQLMMGDKDKIRSNDSQQNIVSAISRMMKILAKEMDCPVIVLSQMSRGIESRIDKTPKLSDLRESGAIEQDADIVLFLSREDEKEKSIGEYNVILDIAKHRNGSLAAIRLHWQGQFVRFSESDNQVINRELEAQKTNGARRNQE